MPLLVIKTEIKAPIERCFDLSRHLNVHMESTHNSRETAILPGKTEGLLNLGEIVTWRARHLGVMQTLTTKITALESPHYFRDEMLQGAFKKIYHEHCFESQNNATIMTDKFYFESPFGFIGDAFNSLYLTGYMTRFLEERNNYIKVVAETDQWQKYLFN